VRDSKHQDGGAYVVDKTERSRFLEDVKGGATKSRRWRQLS